MSTQFLAAIPQFTVTNVVRTAEYWRDVWGFEIAGYHGEPPAFAIVRHGKTELFFNQATPGTHARTGRVPGGYDLYFDVTGVVALAARLRERGATIVEGPVKREYGRTEIVVMDCNGLVVAAGEAS